MDCCAVKLIFYQYRSATASVSDAASHMSSVLLPGVQPTLQLLILAAECVATVMRGLVTDCYFTDTTAYSFEMTDSLVA
jgi:hypothetical protein